MIVNEKELYSFLDTIFLKYNFERKRDTYYLITEECICFFTIRKSEFGGYYDHVMGCFLKALHHNDLEKYPKFNKNDLSYSLRELCQKSLVKEVFDLENNSYFEIQREVIIESLIVNKVIPFLTDINSICGIKKALKKYGNLKYSTKLRLKEYLGIKV